MNKITSRAITALLCAAMALGGSGTPVMAAGSEVSVEASEADPVATATLTISGVAASYTYTGSDIEPQITVQYTSADKKTTSQLTQGTDYTISYENNKNVGKDKAKVKVTGTGSKYDDLAGLTAEKTFSITKATPTITLKSGSKSKTYDGTVLAIGSADFSVDISGLPDTVEYYKNGSLISTPVDTPNIEKLFGDGKRLGMNIKYTIQKEPKGIAQAFTIGADFIGSDDVCLILGDNIFYINAQMEDFKNKVRSNIGKSATIFAHHVSDPERFGVVEFDENFRALSIEEKPKQPKSNYASVGLYFYPSDVVGKAKKLKPSARGELEITDLNRIYLENGTLNVELLGQGFTWLDTGTHESLVEATNFVKTIEQHQHRKIACLEEIAYHNQWITKEDVLEVYELLKKNQYGQYLKDVLDGKYVDILHDK